MYIKYGLQLRRFLLLIGVIILFYFLISLTFPYLYPIILSVLFAYLINPIVAFFQYKIHLPRSLSAIIAICTVFITFLGLLYIIILEIYQGTLYLAEKVPIYFKDLIGYIENFFHMVILPLQEKFFSIFLRLDPSHQKTLTISFNNLMNDIATTGGALLQDFLSNLPKVLTMLPSSITIIIFIILGTFFISNDWDLLKEKVQAIMPVKMKTSTKRVGAQFKKSVFGFMKAQFIIIALSGIIIFFGLIFLGVDHALTIALFSALVDFIPFIGIGMIFIPWIIYLFITGNYSLTIGLSILYAIVLISRQIVEPKILSSNVGVHPLVALFGYFIGFKVWGMFGLIVAPCILIGINVCQQTGIFRWIFQFIKG